MDIVKAKNVTVFAAIHDLNIASVYCDRIIAMKDGKIAGDGTPSELLTAEFIEYLYEVKVKIIKLEDNRPLIIYGTS